MIGSKVSHFRIVGHLGGEGAGMYRAEDLASGSAVLLHLAVSEAPEADASDSAAGAVERFRRAALGAAALSHPNIAAVREIVAAGDGRLFLSLPVVEGETLESLLARGPLPPREALDLAAQIAAALARAHGAGIVHGGLRPSAVLVTSFGEVKVSGFGLGALGALGEAGDDYLAPEVLGGVPPGPRADVWALGVILCEMIAGRHPFSGDDGRARTAAILAGVPEPLPGDGLPRGLERAAARALAHRPEDRYPDAGPLETDLLRAFAAAGTADLAPTRLEIPLAGSPARRPGEGGGVTRTPGGLAGRKLPSYRIFERLGSGGMAVVHRAEDTRLERTVALKFLAPELSRDPEAKVRFLREARAASSLDHPNLCTIHEIGETDDGRIFLSMPYYGGGTLAQRIAHGPLAIDEALDIAVQVAQGLAKAHRHGIVHRDIKPANLMLTPDGGVKIVDFGLAKLAGSSGPRPNLPAGTLDYISPEQARGADVDPRTDLWSLGVVLYEMVAGRRPFGGEHEQAVLYAILRTEPAPLTELRPDAPPELARLVERLLAKEPEQRAASAESLAAELRALRGPESLGSRAVLAPLFVRRRKRSRWIALAALGALATALLGLAFWRFRTESPAEPVPVSYVPITDRPGRAMFPSLAPDGSFVVYALQAGGSTDIWWQRVGGENPQNLTAEPPGVDDTQPAVSPDGRQIAFRSERAGGGLFVMGAAGESVRRISGAGYNPSWSPDGREVICSSVEVEGPGGRGTAGQLWRIDVATAARRLVSTGDAVQPSWSPHSLRIAYWGVPAGTSRRVIWTVPVNGGAPVSVVDDKSLSWSPVWSPDGAYLYFASDRSGSMSLWRVPIDERTGRARGAPQAVAAPTPSGAMPSLSRDGRHIAFATENRRASLVVAAFDPVGQAVTGPLRPVVQSSRVVRSGEISPDGAQIVFDTSEPQEDIYLVRPDGGGLRALTDDAARDRGPHWSGDGRRILFYSDRGGRYEAWTAALPGGLLERLTEERGEVLDPLLSPDGGAVVYSRRSSPELLLDLTEPPGERRPRPLPLSFAVTSWSPDGTWLAGFDRSGIVLYSFAAQRTVALHEPGEEVMWLRDGRTLLFLRGGALFSLDRVGGGARKLLDPPLGSSFQRLSIGPDDRTLLLVLAPTEGQIGMIVLR